MAMSNSCDLWYGEKAVIQHLSTYIYTRKMIENSCRYGPSLLIPVATLVPVMAWECDGQMQMAFGASERL
jgi:hypothetical protein